MNVLRIELIREGGNVKEQRIIEEEGGDYSVLGGQRTLKDQQASLAGDSQGTDSRAKRACAKARGQDSLTHHGMSRTLLLATQKCGSVDQQH